jgi:hypothetical protein
MAGKLSPDLVVNIVPTVSTAHAQQQALGAAAKYFAVNVATLSATQPTLAIFDERLLTPGGLTPHLVWELEVVSTVGAPIKARALVNAANGNLSLFFNQLHADLFSQGGTDVYQVNLGSGSTLGLPEAQDLGGSVRVPGTADLATYDANNGTSLPGTFVCDEGNLACTNGADPDADAAHRDANGTYDMYWNWHDRDSLNGSGFQLKSTVHYSLNYCNAFWNGFQMGYGDGCPIVLDDVVAHELTHGVTNFTSNLVYSYQSGAINESFSDVWGEFYDLTNGSADDTPANRWKLGEPLAANGIRNLKNPPLSGHPDRMQSPLYYLISGDGGGVHMNSGVNNKAAYLLVDGDTFNGQTISGIGILKTAAIYYDAQTTKLTPNSQYADLADAMEQACTELVGTDGITAADCQQVVKTVLATEMRLEPGIDALTADICETGTPVYVFNDGLENGTSNWTSGAITGTYAWTLASTNKPLVGSYSNYGRNLGTVSASFVGMNKDVTLPADAFLHFTHQFNFHYYPFNYYDGGIIEYSTNGGTTWTQLPSAGFFQEGIDYGGMISPNQQNPLKGKAAFVASSNNGIGSTRFTLALLAGQNVRFRWVLGTDQLYDEEGWRIDDIKIYTCSAQAGTATPESTNTPDGSTTPEPTATASATSDGSTATATSTPDGTVTATATIEVTATDSPVGTELLVNQGFEAQDSNSKPDLTPWTLKNPSGDKIKCNKDKNGDGDTNDPEDKIFARTGNCAFVFKGDAGENSKLVQSPDVSGMTFVSGVTLDVNVYTKASGAVVGRVKVRVKYTDGMPTGKVNLDLTASDGYVNVFSGYALTSAAVQKIKFQIDYKGTSGKLFVDDISLLYTGGMGILPLPGSQGR